MSKPKKHLIWDSNIPVEAYPHKSYSVLRTEDSIREDMRRHLPQIPDTDKEGRFGISLVFHINGARHLRYPRLDLDNLIKSTLDRLENYFWLDDSQIDEITAKVYRPSKKGFIGIRVYGL